jgi:hypothetical protein
LGRCTGAGMIFKGVVGAVSLLSSQEHRAEALDRRPR